MSCDANQLILLLPLLLFALLYTTTLLQYSYGSSPLASNTNPHIAENYTSRFVTLDQLSAHVVMDLTGSIAEGAYHVTLGLGKHGREYTFMIDSGSDITWVNCERNSRYHYPHPPYNPPVRRPVLCGDPICHDMMHPEEHPCHSATDKCYYKEEYGDGATTTGEMIIETLSLPFVNVHRSLRHPSIKIGCGNHNHHPPITVRDGVITFDGIMGLAKKSSITILDQLEKKGLTRSMFGHCMARPRGGYFFIGAGKPLPHAITWARMVQIDEDDIMYSLGRAKLVVGSTFSLPNLHTMFDSGCTYSYLDRRSLQALIGHIKAHLAQSPLKPFSRQSYPICWRAAGHTIRSVEDVAPYFKTMTLVFSAANNAQFQVPPYAYLTVPEEGGHVCLAIFDSSQIELSQYLILGEIFFQNKLVVYDLVGKRIGWAPSHCEHRRMNDLKAPRHVTDREYNIGDLPIHRFSSNIPVWQKRHLVNYSTTYQIMK